VLLREVAQNVLKLSSIPTPCQATIFFMNFPLQCTQKVAVFKHSYLWFYLDNFEKILYLESGKDVLQAYQIS